MHRDGHEVDVALSAAPIYGADGKVAGTMVTIADITPRKIAEAALRESESQLRLAMDAAQLGMWYWECDSDRFTYSEGLNVLFGRPAESSLAHYRDLRERIHSDDRDLVDATIRHAVRQAEDFTADFRVVWPDGSVHWIANRGQVHRGAEGRAQRVVGVAMNITERKIAEQRIAHMAHHDALTGLPNRVLLRDRIQQAIAQAHRNGTQLAVLFLDLDRFKTINDSLGHQLGDRLLQSVASRILVCVREGDTVSRVGGDEFVIVIPGIGSSSDASNVAGKILEVLASAFHLHGNDLHVAASIGISLYPADGSDAETLMRNADTAMYHAKDSGRGNFQFFTQHMNVAAQQRLTLENALRRALEMGEFQLYYQPLFNLADRTVTGFEALLRWNPPGGAVVVPPGEFIGVAEDSGLIVPIGDWVLGEALRHAASWQSPGRRLSIAINVSANQLSRNADRGAPAPPRERVRDRSEADRARGHRTRDHRGRGRGAAHARRPRGPRRGHRHRRLRHRLLGPRVPEAPAHRHGEDRPVVRARPHHRPGRRRDRDRDRRDGTQPRRGRGRRGDRDRRAAGRAHATGLPPRAGLPAREPHDRGAGRSLPRAVRHPAIAESVARRVAARYQSGPKRSPSGLPRKRSSPA